MSLQKLATEIQKKGRGDDRMLVHMTPGEVRGLQAIARAHGGSLTINPDTGLVEAGFLKRILPMVAGAALTGLSGGAINPLTAGLITGGFETARTGDISKGLMAGLGAYGGAGLAGSLGSAGSSTLATPEAVAGQLGTPAATGPGSQAALLAEQNAGFGVQGLEGIRSAASTATPITPQFDGSVLAGQPIGSSAQAALPTTGQQLSAGVKQVTASPEALGTFGKQNMMNIGAAAAPMAAEAMTPKPIDTQEEEYKRKYPELSLADSFRGYTPATPNPYYRPTGLGYAEGGEIDGYFGGGGIGMGGMLRGLFSKLKGNRELRISPDFQPSEARQPNNHYVPQGLGYAAGGDVGFQNVPNGGLASIQSMRDAYGAPQTMDGNIPQFAAGGKPEDARRKRATRTSAAQLAAMDPMEAGIAQLNNARAMAQMGGGNFALPKRSVEELGVINAAQGGSIGGYSDGGRMLKGPGDGMSDSIPATINRRQPARLADGEFVVPADVVSHIGNGSTDAGAKKLYAMMDRVRVARTGKKKQAPAVKTGRYLPA